MHLISDETGSARAKISCSYTAGPQGPKAHRIERIIHEEFYFVTNEDGALILDPNTGADHRLKEVIAKLDTDLKAIEANGFKEQNFYAGFFCVETATLHMPDDYPLRPWYFHSYDFSDTYYSIKKIIDFLNNKFSHAIFDEDIYLTNKPAPSVSHDNINIYNTVKNSDNPYENIRLKLTGVIYSFYSTLHIELNDTFSVMKQSYNDLPCIANQDIKKHQELYNNLLIFLRQSEAEHCDRYWCKGEIVVEIYSVTGDKNEKSWIHINDFYDLICFKTYVRFDLPKIILPPDNKRDYSENNSLLSQSIDTIKLGTNALLTCFSSCMNNKKNTIQQQGTKKSAISKISGAYTAGPLLKDNRRIQSFINYTLRFVEGPHGKLVLDHGSEIKLKQLLDTLENDRTHIKNSGFGSQERYGGFLQAHTKQINPDGTESEYIATLDFINTYPCLKIFMDFLNHKFKHGIFEEEFKNQAMLEHKKNISINNIYAPPENVYKDERVMISGVIYFGLKENNYDIALNLTFHLLKNPNDMIPCIISPQDLKQHQDLVNRLNNAIDNYPNLESCSGHIVFGNYSSDGSVEMVLLDIKDIYKLSEFATFIQYYLQLHEAPPELDLWSDGYQAKSYTLFSYLKNFMNTNNHKAQTTPEDEASTITTKLLLS